MNQADFILWSLELLRDYNKVGLRHNQLIEFIQRYNRQFQ